MRLFGQLLNGGRAVVACLAVVCGSTAAGCLSWERDDDDASVELDAAVEDAATPGPDHQPETDSSTVDASAAEGCPSDPKAFRWIEVSPGKFFMGSGELSHQEEIIVRQDCGSQDEDAHLVQLTRPFVLSQTEVTRAQYEDVMRHSAPAYTCADADCPVTVSWDRAVEFCNRLSEKEGLAACYKCDGGSCVQLGTFAQDKIYACPGYRLPTEAEWEYAYRAGTEEDFYNGPITDCEDTDPKADEIGWYDRDAAQPVCRKKPNQWGLFDMAGNRREWVNDRYIEHLGHEEVVDPWGGEPTAKWRITRSGNYRSPPKKLRGASRTPVEAVVDQEAGIRCARTLLET